MPYVLLIKEPREQRQGRSEENGRAVYDRMLRFTEDLQARGLLKASNSLRHDREAVRVEVRGGRPVLTDGPFSESKEMVGGFFYLDCKSMEEAVAIASSCPAAEWSAVEVREVGPCYLD